VEEEEEVVGAAGGIAAEYFTASAAAAAAMRSLIRSARQRSLASFAAFPQRWKEKAILK